MTRILQVAAIAVATLGAGAATQSVMNEDIPDFEVPQGARVSSGALDGRAFTILGVDVESGAVLEAALVSEGGCFASVGCQNDCDSG